jgi:hypothetical protein
MATTTGPPDALTRFHELAPQWRAAKSGARLAAIHKGLAREGFSAAEVDSAVDALIAAGAVKSADSKNLYPSEAARVKSLKWDEAQKLRLDAIRKSKALRKAIKDTPKIERRFLYAGVLAKAIADDPTLSIYAKMAAVVIDDRLNNFPKHRRRNRTIGYGELAERMGKGVGKATAYRAVQELLDGVYLYVEPGGGRRSNHYGFTSDIETYGREELNG